MNRRHMMIAAIVGLIAPVRAMAVTKVVGTPVLVDRFGFLHMGGWVRPDHVGAQVGDTFILTDDDHNNLYTVIGRK